MIKELVGLLCIATLHLATTPIAAAAGCVANAEIINVKDFGAAGNGIVDDTAPIQNALVCFDKRMNADAAHTASLYFPSGLYLVRAPLALVDATGTWKGLSIRGDGSAASRIVIDKPIEIFNVSLASRATEVSVARIGFYAGNGAAGGTVINISAPNGAAMAGTRSLSMQDVAIGSLAATAAGTSSYFSYGIKSSGLNRPLIDNVFMGNTYGPFASKDPKGDTCFLFSNAYAPTIRHSECWSSRVGADISSSVSGNEAFSALNALFVNVGIGIRLSSLTTERGARIIDCHANFYSAGILLTNEASPVVSGNLLYIQQPLSSYPNESPRDIVLSNSPNATISGNLSHAPRIRFSPTDVKRVAVTVAVGSDGARITNNIYNHLGTAIIIAAGVKNTTVLDNNFFVHTADIVDNGIGTAIKKLPANPPM